MTITIGVDPGITGALAVLQDGKHLLMLIDMPTVSSGKSVRVSRSVDSVGLSKAVGGLLAAYPLEYVSAIVEKTFAMPGQGVSSTYSMGHSRGVVEGVFLTKGIPTQLVAPIVWKKKMGFNSDKEFVRGEISKLFPTASLHRKKDHDRAEAIGLALYLHQEKFK
jgi:crossover junction endodeoxyribonuclease RuvC